MNTVGNRNHIFVFLGAPGAGKGSLSERCIAEFGWTQLSTGNLCRKHISQGSAIGKEIDFAIKSGKLISDRLISQMVQEWLERAQLTSSVILDGYPRTIAQAESMNQWMQESGQTYGLSIVKLSIEPRVIIERLVQRRVCSSTACQAVYSLTDPCLAPQQEGLCDKCSEVLIQRSDDTPDAIKHRLDVYSQHEKPLLEYYQNAGYSLLSVNAEQPIDRVFTEFKQLVSAASL